MYVYCPSLHGSKSQLMAGPISGPGLHPCMAFPISIRYFLSLPPMMILVKGKTEDVSTKNEYPKPTP